MQYYAPSSTLSNYYNKIAGVNITTSSNVNVGRITVGTGENYGSTYGSHFISTKNGTVGIDISGDYIKLQRYSGNSTTTGVEIVDDSYENYSDIIVNSGWGGYTGVGFNGKSLQNFLSNTGVKFMSINGTFRTNATTYYSYYYHDIPFSSVGLTGKFLIGNPWVFLATNIPALIQIADGNTIRINSTADARGKAFIVRVAYTDKEFANTTKNV